MPERRGWASTSTPDAIAEARERAAGLPARFEVRDAATIEGSFDAVINVGASHAHGGFPAALNALQTLGGAALYGEGFWERPPSDGFLAGLGGASADELSDLDGLRAAVREAGFDIAFEWVASQDDWTRYEGTLAANAERHGTADTLAYARRIRDRRRLPGGTDTLGFALLVLHARLPPSSSTDPLTPGESRCVRGSSRSPGHAAPAKGSRVAPPPGCRRARRLR